MTPNVDYSGNLSIHVPYCSSGNTILNQSNQTITVHTNGHTYSGFVDSSSNISYHLTSYDHADASGHFSATIFDVNGKIGKMIISSSNFVHSYGSNVVTDGSGGTITIPLYCETVQESYKINAVSISSYITYNGHTNYI